MAKAGYFARPIEEDGKHHPQASRKEEQEPAKWSHTVRKAADAVRGWLPSAEARKEG